MLGSGRNQREELGDPTAHAEVVAIREAAARLRELSLAEGGSGDGWRLADWYDERRRRLARGLPGTDGITPEDRAALVMAMDFGLTAQHLLDPDRVPADLYATGLNLLLGPPLHRPSP